MRSAVAEAQGDGAQLPLSIQVGLLAGPFLSMLDSSIVNVALPNIASQFGVSLATVQWVISGYLLALATALAASAYLAKRFGTGRVYLASLVGFTLASALCALSPNVEVLIFARGLQGMLGAPLVPLAMTMHLGRGAAARQIPPAFGVLLFLAPDEAPDASTLFNLAQRLGGSVGISLLVTFFQLRERARVQDVLRSLALAPGSVSHGAGSTVPPMVQARLAGAAARGFHDTVILLVLLSLAGVVLAALLSGPASGRATGEEEGAGTAARQLSHT